jgi:hypothetical protein
VEEVYNFALIKCGIETETAKADTEDKIKTTINHYFSQGLNEQQIVLKMSQAKISNEVIAKYFPNSFKVVLSF